MVLAPLTLTPQGRAAIESPDRADPVGSGANFWSAVLEQEEGLVGIAPELLHELVDARRGGRVLATGLGHLEEATQQELTFRVVEFHASRVAPGGADVQRANAPTAGDQL